MSFRTRLPVGTFPERISRGIRGCQTYSFSNTQDILNIPTGSRLDSEQDEEPVILRNAEQILDEGLTDGD